MRTAHDDVIRFRIPHDEKRRITFAAHREGMTVSEFLRERVAKLDASAA